jgi:hypothetical protein
MKKIYILIAIIIGFSSCKNFETDFPDYGYTSGYFPYQYPVRTIILGDYIYDNSNDNAHKFVISAAMGGTYSNERDRVFDIEVDETLCDKVLFNADGDTIQALPDSYYTLSSNDKLVIKSGKFNGGIEVQLTDEFFNDPDAIKLTYVVPIRLVSSDDVDRILSGTSEDPDPDPRTDNWTVTPKDFTMFAVKYINEYHGTYFHYGQSNVKDGTNTVIESTAYSEDYVEFNNTSKLVTTGRNQVLLSTFLKSEVMSGEVQMLLNFDGDNCTITEAEGSPYSISGTGVFKSKEFSWGNKERNGIELTFTVSDGTYTYEASDVLVVRDRGVVMEVYSPVVY